MSDDNTPKYAAVSDIEDRLMHQIDADQSTYVDNMIASASEFIDEFIDNNSLNPSDSVKKRVVVDIVVAWYATTEFPLGASSITQSVDGVSQSVAFAASSQSVKTPFWLSREQKKALGLRSTFGSIQMVPDDWRRI